MLLTDKRAVVYGAAGHIGSAVARAFAREGARLFLAGRTLATLQPVADEIIAAGGQAEVAAVDALDAQAVGSHMDEIVGKAGGIDISFNAIWIRGDLQGTPLLEMTCEDFTAPVLVGAKAHFLTATAAARQMVQQGSGVILTLSSSSAGLAGRDRVFHRTGGFSTACVTIEGFSRSLAGEVGPQGVRVICLRPDALPETWSGDHPEARKFMDEGTVLGRLPTLAEVGNAAVLMASDYAGAMTGTIANLTCGSILDAN